MLVEKYNKMMRDNAPVNLDKYANTKTMKRLKGKGQFCGMDYVRVKELIPIEFYSRFNHSENVAYTASKLIDVIEAIFAGYVHDVGVLSFAHVNSFKKGDALRQDSDELDVKLILLKDEEFLEYLHEDGINLDDIVDAKRYPLIDKEIPCLCLDRAEGGILATCLFWAHTHTFEEIEDLYNMLCYIDHLNGMSVDILNPRFQNFTGEVFINEHHTSADYEDFFKAINVYSEKLLSKESRYMMEVLGLTLRFYEDMGVIDEKVLFELSEKEIIYRIMNSKYKDIWIDVTSIERVDYGSSGLSFISKPKIRQANP
ncbi:MAG: hypothetical protein K2L98_00775, partial [Bacilli bacterium]|nr:hypothetical protein [Bacilli bacterium]